jgi:glutamate-1-semialdehyde aminotransferase
MKRGEDIMLGVSLIGDWPPSHFVSRYRDGWFLEDVDGNRYIDWLAGWELFALGCDIVEECVVEVSKAHAKGIAWTHQLRRAGEARGGTP